MKAKMLIPWLIAVALLAGAALLYSSNQKKDEALAGLRESSQQMEQQLRAELEQAKTTNANQNAEVAQFRKDTEDLLRLRNEVRQLREDKQQLTKQAQTAQTEAQRVQAQATQAVRTGAQQQAQQLQQLQTENERLRVSALQQQNVQLAACINNLRQIDGAKQQWALENRKTAAAVPTAQDLAPYFKDGVLPACPAGGQYTINALNAAPACSIPGHALPQVRQ